MNKLATVLLCANFITVLFPQPGYIHPDEFFQSSEIVAGDVLGIQHFRVWEFNGTSAVRNIVFPYIVMSPTLYLLRWINLTGISEFQLSAVKVVMATRLPISVLSLLGYIATGRLADVFHVNRYVSTVLYCSSYVTWTYYTRTFSNSLESVLLAIVLLLVLTFSGGVTANHQKMDTTFVEDFKYNSKSSTKTEGFDKIPKHESRIDQELEEDDAEPEKLKDNRLMSAANDKKTVVESTQPKKKSENERDNSEEIKTYDKELTVGRVETDEKKSRNETKDTDTKKHKPENVEMKLRWKDKNAELSNLRTFVAKLISFILGAVVAAGFFNRPTFLLFVVVPVIYWIWNVTGSDRQGRWRAAPLISIALNLSLGALFIFIIFVLLDTLYFNPEFLIIASKILQSFTDDHFSLQVVQTSLKTLVHSLVVTPWNFLEYNSNLKNLEQHGLHPRYTHFLVNLPLLLGPLYIPFIIVCVVSIFQIFRKSEQKDHKINLAWLTFMALVPVLGLSIFPHQEPRFLIPALPVFVVMGAKIVSAMTPGKLSFFALWAAFNIFLTIVYGYMHQAALIPALSIYQQKLSSSSHLSKNYHIIFYKTYSPPRHLLLLPRTNSHVSIHELAGAPISTFVQTVKEAERTCRKSDIKCQTYVFVPSTVTPRLLEHLASYKISTTSICPHLSIEAPPRIWAWWKKRLSFDEMVMDFCLNILTLT